MARTLEDVTLKDGIYEVPPDFGVFKLKGADDRLAGNWEENAFELISKEFPQAVPFMETNPNFVLAMAYQVDDGLLLSSKPPKFKGEKIGSGFNHVVDYGSNNLLRGITPGNGLLILAAND